MAKLRLIALLLTAAFGGMTLLCNGQDSGRLCLTYPEFDFYANALVERNGLAVDTAILNALARANAIHIYQQEEQLRLAAEQVIVKDSIANIHKSAYTDLSKKHEKQGRNLRIFKKTTLVFVVSTLLLGTFVFLK